MCHEREHSGELLPRFLYFPKNVRSPLLLHECSTFSDVPEESVHPFPPFGCCADLPPPACQHFQTSLVKAECSLKTVEPKNKIESRELSGTAVFTFTFRSTYEAPTKSSPSLSFSLDTRSKLNRTVSTASLPAGWQLISAASRGHTFGFVLRFAIH